MQQVDHCCFAFGDHGDDDNVLGGRGEGGA